MRIFDIDGEQGELSEEAVGEMKRLILSGEIKIRRWLTESIEITGSSAMFKKHGKLSKRAICDIHDLRHCGPDGPIYAVEPSNEI